MTYNVFGGTLNLAQFNSSYVSGQSEKQTDKNTHRNISHPSLGAK